MAKVLFINGNLHGHMNPTLPVVKELVNHGEEVYYFSTKEFQQKIEATGATFMDYGERFDQFVAGFRPHGSHPFYTILEYMLGLDRTVISIVLDMIKGLHFDYILHDVMFGGGSILSKKLNLPAIATCTSFILDTLPVPPRMLEPGFHPQLDSFYRDFEEAKLDWNTPDMQVSNLFFKKEKLNLVFTSKLFHPNGDHYDTSYQFVGPSIADRKEVLDFNINVSTKQKVIYISMGTIMNYNIEFYHKCFEAFANDEYQVVMSVGNKVDLTSLNSIPANFIVKNYVPQLEVLKHTDVFISHGGLNSVSEALYHHVPLICIPLGNDQPAVAHQLVELGAGLELKPDEITPELLKNSVKKILSEPGYKEASQKIGESFIHAGGYHKAAQLILDFKTNLK